MMEMKLSEITSLMVSFDLRNLEGDYKAVQNCINWQMLGVVRFTFIGHFGSNHSALYLYMATKAGFSSTPCYVHAQASKGVWLMYIKVRTLQNGQKYSG